MTHPVARICAVVVGRILTPRFAKALQVRAKFRARDLEHRPDTCADARRHAAETRGPRAAHEAQQHRLGLVVARMRQRHPVGPERLASAKEEGLPRVPAGHLQRLSGLGRERRHVRVLHEGHHPRAQGQVAAERGVVVGRRAANVVMQVDETGRA